MYDDVRHNISGKVNLLERTCTFNVSISVIITCFYFTDRVPSFHICLLICLLQSLQVTHIVYFW